MAKTQYFNSNDYKSDNPSKHELEKLRRLLETREKELKEALKENEHTITKLHLVQEELEHYFLENRNLHQMLIPQAKRIKSRILRFFSTSPHTNLSSGTATMTTQQLKFLLIRQQQIINRFQALILKNEPTSKH